jgi:hypothetical protein
MRHQILSPQPSTSYIVGGLSCLLAKYLWTTLGQQVEALRGFLVILWACMGLGMMVG